jgi:eukaryotic-like serine/threonine-protein kinase
MPLAKGDRLGPYEILALVGQGGMGEVYRAHDDRLRRDVAIKVSNAQFTERFTLEARAIAALNHTNICHLYDVVIAKDAPNYLVMEYVEGEDLKGPLDFGDALPILQQLIDGIEAAHEKNIVHRDLKPANIKITPEGVVKILDFGLAKAMDPLPASGSNPENSPTLTIGATAVGTILGTAAYMAPEQAKGKQADKRSDIWSFGVILYEVLTGRKLFTGETAVEILAGVLNQDPDLSAAPPRVHKLLRWCLEKDRKQRLASISDARRLLSESDEARRSCLARTPRPAQVTTTRASRRSRSRPASGRPFSAGASLPATCPHPTVPDI